MRTRIGIRLVLGAALVTATVVGGMAYAILRLQTGQLLAERTRCADQLSADDQGRRPLRHAGEPAGGPTPPDP